MDRNLTNPQHDLHPFSVGEPACRLGAWVDLIGFARWEDNGGLKAGQVKGSVRFLAERWRWSRSRVQRFLADLEESGRIRRTPGAGRKPSTITICNYSTYQDPGVAERDTNEDASEDASEDANEDKDEQEQEQGKEKGSVNTLPKKKRFPMPGNLSKDGSGRYQYPAPFETLWNAYPNRYGGNPKKAAYRQWRIRVVEDGTDPDVILTAVEHYAEHVRRENKAGTEYVPMARTFLGQDELFRDWIEPPTSPGGAGSDDERSPLSADEWDDILEELGDHG